MTPVEYLKRPYSRLVVPEADGTYRSEILEFPGCLATGETAADALANLEDVAASWLESVLARGQVVPAPFEENEYSGKLVLRLAKSVHQNAAVAARQDCVSLNTFIANCVAEHLGARKAPVHLTTHFSQQNNVLFLGQGKTYIETSNTVPSSSRQTIVEDLRPSNTPNQPNPWKHDA
jgi:predicted RNase H-like HicB family nuclease